MWKLTLPEVIELLTVMKIGGVVSPPTYLFELCGLLRLVGVAEAVLARYVSTANHDCFM